jgi:hypothetical protein
MVEAPGERRLVVSFEAAAELSLHTSEGERVAHVRSPGEWPVSCSMHTHGPKGAFLTLHTPWLPHARQVSQGTKRALCAEHEAGDQPGLRLASALPRTVWVDHLLAYLKRTETLTLRVTCKALRGIVAEMCVDLEEVLTKDLRRALTCFPKAYRVELYDDFSMSEEEEKALLASLVWQGRNLTCVDGALESGDGFIRRAWRAGAFPKVRAQLPDWAWGRCGQLASLQSSLCYHALSSFLLEQTEIRRSANGLRQPARMGR